MCFGELCNANALFVSKTTTQPVWGKSSQGPRSGKHDVLLLIIDRSSLMQQPRNLSKQALRMWVLADEKVHVDCATLFLYA